MKANWIVEMTVAFAAIATGACSETPVPRMVANPMCAAQRVTVVTPPNRAHVPYRPVISGTVYPACSAVWLVIRGPDQNLYWVQPKPEVTANGQWSAQVFVGNPRLQYGAIEDGGAFKLIALANPTKPLAPGQALHSLPDAEARSGIVLLDRGGPPPRPY